MISLPPHADTGHQKKPVAGLFDRPFDLVTIATMLLDDKFFMAAYVACGQPDRWFACADQLPELFIEFMNAEIPEAKLLDLGALMFRWAARLPDADRQPARQYLANKLDFIGAERITARIRKMQRIETDGVVIWHTAPWRVGI